MYGRECNCSYIVVNEDIFIDKDHADGWKYVDCTNDECSNIFESFRLLDRDNQTWINFNLKLLR